MWWYCPDLSKHLDCSALQQNKLYYSLFDLGLILHDLDLPYASDSLILRSQAARCTG